MFLGNFKLVFENFIRGIVLERFSVGRHSLIPFTVFQLFRSPQRRRCSYSNDSATMRQM